MLKIHCQTLINLKNFKLLTARHSSFYQLRINIFSQPTNQKKTSPLIPYLILTPDKSQHVNPHQNDRQSKTNNNNTSSQQMVQRMNSYDSKFSSNMDIENKGKNIGEIDSQTNSYLTKSFLARHVDQFLSIDEVVVFKGSFDVSIQDIVDMIRNKNAQNHIRHTFNRVYVNCQLFAVSSFSTESIGLWYGYTLPDQGTIALPIRFFSFNSSYLQTEITFLWTSIQFTQLNNTKNIPETQIAQISQFLREKYAHLSSNILNFPKNVHQKPKNIKNPHQNSTKTLKQTITQYNQQVYELWKKYQDFQQKNILTPKTQWGENFINKIQLFQQNLAAYHWKNHIIVTEETGNAKYASIEQSEKDSKEIKESLHLEERKNTNMPSQLIKLKRDPQIDSDLVFYPFENHQKVIKLQNQDFRKIFPISSLGQAFSLKEQDRKQKTHLIVFVHGYQASGFDMQNLAAFFKYKQPTKIKVLVSTTNEGRTQQPMQESGHRLAVQIKNFINNKFQHDDFDISFICHSMGGLIARAALKYLQLYKSKFRTFLSLCSPHLGYLYHTSTLVKTSLWVLNQVKKDPSMIELTMEDNPELEKTFLYQLSTRNQLEWFKYPIFIGSREDQYIPFWSALVRDKDFFFQTKEAKVYKRLYKNLTQRLQAKIIRLQAIYKVKINDISSFVGRTAHIRILNCIEIMEMIYLLTEKAF